MPDESNLEQFKIEFTRDYIDRGLDRLLDLRNAVKGVQSTAEMSKLIQTERVTVLHDMGIELKPRKKDATKEVHDPNSEEGKGDSQSTSAETP